MFRKAERRKAKLRLAITGPAGSGKTYGALQIAQGLGGRIAMIDTENGSGDLYSDICDYDVQTLTAPYRNILRQSTRQKKRAMTFSLSTHSLTLGAAKADSSTCTTDSRQTARAEIHIQRGGRLLLGTTGS